VTFDNTGQTAEIHGSLLKSHGLVLHLRQPMTSELLILEAVG
jgi:hypothetical protein